MLVRDGRIAAIGPSRSVRVPAGARRIDGRGKYLIPGLADMHTHLFSDDAVPDSVAPDELGVMVANGVTTIAADDRHARAAGAPARHHRGPRCWGRSSGWQARSSRGKQYDNGRVVTTPEQARAAVREVKADGYDFVKLTLFITRPVYDAITDEAKRRRDPRGGARGRRASAWRAPSQPGSRSSTSTTTSRPSLADSAPMQDIGDAVRGVPAGQLARASTTSTTGSSTRIAGATARGGIWSSPTLNVFNQAFAIGDDRRRDPRDAPTGG